ncbi:MAG TPA: zf-HC2 domain-containing protein [Bacteroidota bacterium]|nr:zf-HC2 domain-containing protein [Bacteroidota bacterium]
MNHTHYQELTSQFIDRELGHEDERELFAHLGRCDRCRGFLKTALILQEDLHRTKEEASKFLTPMTVYSLDPSAKSGRPAILAFRSLWRANIPVPLAFGLIAVLIVIGVLLARPAEIPQSIQTQAVPQSKAVMSMPTIVVSLN